MAICAIYERGYIVLLPALFNYLILFWFCEYIHYFQENTAATPHRSAVFQFYVLYWYVRALADLLVQSDCILWSTLPSLSVD